MRGSRQEKAAGLATAALAAALLASLSGEILWFAISTYGDNFGQLESIDAIVIPLYIIGGAMVAVGPVLIGIATLGIPLFLASQGRIERHLMAGISVLVGAIAGWLVYRWISSGYDEDWQARVRDIGVLYGAPAGLFWALLARRFVKNRQKES